MYACGEEGQAGAMEGKRGWLAYQIVVRHGCCCGAQRRLLLPRSYYLCVWCVRVDVGVTKAQQKGGFIISAWLTTTASGGHASLLLFAQHNHPWARSPTTHTCTTDTPLCGRRPAAEPAPARPPQTMREPSSTGGEVRALWSTETSLLDSLMYRNKNQHGRAGYWKRLQVSL